MKKTILSITAIAFLFGMLLTGCNTSGQKVKDAEEDVIKAKLELDEANMEYQADMESFREEANRKTISNDQMIAELKSRMANEKKSLRGEYEKKINDLETWNNDLKNRFAEYNEEGKDNWERFKADFSHDLEELGIALKSFWQ
jgi:predicted small secreted protein